MSSPTVAVGRKNDTSPSSPTRWLNRTVLGIGLTSLFSDLCHETATALSLYVLHEIFYMGCSYPVGHLGDKFDKRKLLAGGYALAAVMGASLMFAPLTLPVLATAFVLAGIYVATQDALEDALAPSWWTRRITASVSARWRR